MVNDPEQHRRGENSATGPLLRAESNAAARPLAVPFVSKPSGETPQTKPTLRKEGSGRVTWERWANWVVGVSSGIFLLIAVGGYFYHRGQLAEIAAEHLRLMVTGPARLSIGVAQHYTARTTTVTGHGLPAQVEFAWYGPDGRQLMAHKEAADEHGVVNVTVEADARWQPEVRMEVVASHSIRSDRVEARLAVEPQGCLTALCLQQPECRPGETLRYRSLTLSRFSLAADRALPIRFEIRAANGSLVADSVREGITVKGVGWGEFPIPHGLSEGVYSLHAISLDKSFPEVRRQFAVSANRPSKLKLDLEFLRDRYAPGDKVIADFSCRRHDGRPAAKVRVKAVAAVFDKTIHEAAGETTGDGLFRTTFVLPERLEQPVGQVRIAVEDDKIRESLVRPIPISSGGIRVSFRPEGGELVSGMENRVYFAARDSAGNPVRLSGRIVDGQDRAVAPVETAYEGMGSVQFEPQAAQQYRLEVDPPSEGQAKITLPPVSSHRSVVLTTGLGVIEPGAPLEFNVRAAAADLPLMAVVSCRGIEVGQQTLVTSLGANTVTVPLHEDAAGALRLVLYEYRSNPPKLVAERLVYRRPPKRFEAKAALPGASLRPGQSVELPLRVTDEQGRPAPADLSVAVFDESAGETASREASVPAFSGPLGQFLLLGDLEGPEVGHVSSVPDVESYLFADANAPANLDLLLGAFARRQPSAAEGAAGTSAPAAGITGTAAGGFGCSPPMMFDNLHQLLDRYQASLASYRVNRTRVLNALTTLSFFGGIGLVVFVAMLSLLNVPCGLRLWGPALGVAAACIVIGAVLMDPERLKRNPGGDIPFASTETPSDSQPNQPPTTAGAAIARQDLRPFPPVATALQTEPGKATADGGSQASLVWHPLVSADQQGRASVRVQLPARPGSCRILLDAHAESGRLGGSSTPVTYSMPFRLEPRVPAVVSVGDRMDVPVGIVNDSDHRLTIQLSVEHGPSVRIEGESRRTLELAPRHRADEHLILHALGPQGDCSLRFHAKSGDLTADATRAVTIRAAGYPAEWSSSGRIEGRKEMLVRLPDPLPPGSVDAQLLLFPSLAADAQTAMDALAGGHATDLDWAAALSGAGAIVLRELASDGLADPVLIRLAKERNQAAESARSKCVCPTGGYDRFGVDPGCEATTALAVWQVGQASDGPSADPAFARGLKWLLDRRDGSGGFVRGARPQRAAQDWLARHKETVDAYILWALTESGQRNLEAELNRALESAAKSDDPYRLALVAKAALNSGRKTEARPLLDKLAKLQLPDGHLVGAASITASGGASLAVETTALATLAWLGLPQYASQADRATGWIVEHRDASGTFGAPHATLLALTALAADARRDRAARREGKCVIQRAEETRRAGSPVRAEAGRVGDPTYVAVAEQTISAGQRATVGIGGWQGRLVSGENRLAVELAGAGPMPYLLAVRYRSAKPPGDPACPVRLAAKLARANAKVGQAVPLEVQLVNATDRGLPMVVAIIGFPAGMEVRSERLDAMRQSGTLDAYKVRTGELVCCWRSLAPKATAIVQLDLAAVSAGKFTGSASRAYLHDTPESKHWVEPLAIEITRE